MGKTQDSKKGFVEKANFLSLIWYIEHHDPTTEKKLTKKRKKNKLDIVSVKISCQQPQTVLSLYPLAKTQVALNRVSAAQKQAKTVFCRKLGVIPPMMTISLSQNWLPTVDSDVLLSVLRYS